MEIVVHSKKSVSKEIAPLEQEFQIWSVIYKMIRLDIRRRTKKSDSTQKPPTPQPWLEGVLKRRLLCHLRNEVIFVRNHSTITYDFSHDCSTSYFTLMRPVPSPREGFGGHSPPKKLQAPPNWNMKHYKLVEFLSDLYVNPPFTNVKPPEQT